MKTLLRAIARLFASPDDAYWPTSKERWAARAHYRSK